MVEFYPEQEKSQPRLHFTEEEQAMLKRASELERKSYVQVIGFGLGASSPDIRPGQLYSALSEKATAELVPFSCKYDFFRGVKAGIEASDFVAKQGAFALELAINSAREESIV